MRIPRRGWVAPAILALAAAGCGGGSTTAPPPADGTIETAPPPKPAAAATQTPPTDPAAAVQLTEVSVAEWEAAIAARKGKVVLVDVWFYG